MSLDLEIVPVDGDCLLDSRLLARYLGYAHETVLRNITRHKVRLEQKSFLRQCVGKTTTDERGRGRPERYYLLDQRQCLLLTGSLKKGDEVLDWQEALIDAFLRARARVRELESQHQAPTQPEINSLWQQRLLDFNRRTHIPAGYWSIFNMVAGYCFTDEFRGVHLIDEALPDGSIGRRWCDYLRAQGYDMRLIVARTCTTIQTSAATGPPTSTQQRGLAPFGHGSTARTSSTTTPPTSKRMRGRYHLRRGSGRYHHRGARGTRPGERKKGGREKSRLFWNGQAPCVGYTNKKDRRGSKTYYER